MAKFFLRASRASFRSLPAMLDRNLLRALPNLGCSKAPSARVKYFGPVFERNIDDVKKMSFVNHSWTHTFSKTMMKQIFQTFGGEGFCSSTVRNVWILWTYENPPFNPESLQEEVGPNSFIYFYGIINIPVGTNMWEAELLLQNKSPVVSQNIICIYLSFLQHRTVDCCQQTYLWKF